MRKLLYFILFLSSFINSSNAQTWSIKIETTSDEYLVYNTVDFKLLVTSGNSGNESLEKHKKQPLKEVVGALKTTLDGQIKISFQTNNGYVVHKNLYQNKWYFNRDSVMQNCDGILKLKVSYSRSISIFYDSIQIVLPKKIIKIEPNWGDKRIDYFDDVFENNVKVYFDDGRSKITYPKFYNIRNDNSKSSILNEIMVNGDVYFKDGKCKLKYDNPQKTKQLEFVYRKTNQLVCTTNIPKSIYTRVDFISIKPIQSEIKNINGKDGNNYRIDSISNELFYQIDKEGNRIDSLSIFKMKDFDLALINGANGMNGTHGINAKSMMVKIDRANEIDSIAKISVLFEDTTYVYYIDIINGGVFKINCNGGNGTSAGHGGECGYIENSDSVLYWGISGKGGVGGSGGNGSDITIVADSIYLNYMENIMISNYGGMFGLGGVDGLQITTDIAPFAGYYYKTGGALFLTGSLRIKATEIFTAYNPPRFIFSKLPKTKGKNVDGKHGKSGQIIYNFY
jgi:hypothetical protein